MSDKVFCDTSGITLIFFYAEWTIPMRLEAADGIGARPVWAQIPPAPAAWTGETQGASGRSPHSPPPGATKARAMAVLARAGALGLAATPEQADRRAMPVARNHSATRLLGVSRSL
jgi:hypothetical protein